ncbi:hypothetical protein QQ045_028696 [Rhodiola kirilowii]
MIIVEIMDRDFKSDKPLSIAGHNVVSLNPRLTQYVANAGFLPWSQVCNVKIDPKLCTALVERWRPETHTFHLNGGEATITLQDVALLTGLPIDGGARVWISRVRMGAPLFEFIR